MSGVAVKEVVFIATPIPGHLHGHNMLMTVNGKVVDAGPSRCACCTAKTLVEAFRCRFPDAKITFKDRTVN